MIKFSLVDVSSIQASVPRSNFSEDQIEQLADMILESEGVLKVILLTQTGINNYRVLAGDLEYYAAVRAKEKNPRQGEMINAIITQPSNQETLLKQVEQTGVTPIEKTSLEQLKQQLNELRELHNRDHTETNTKFETLSQIMTSSGDSQINNRLQQLENYLKVNVDKLTQLVEQILTRLPPPPPIPINLQNANHQEIRQKLENVGVKDKQIKAAIKAIDRWKEVEGGLTWKNLKNSTKPGKDKIKDFGTATYEELEKIGKIPDE
jgi:hypothetical protein